VEIEPKAVMDAKNSYVGEEKSDVIKKFMIDYEITNNEEDYTTSEDIKYWIQNNDLKISSTSFGLQMNKYVKINRLVNVLSKVKKVNGKSKQVWVGIKEIIETREIKPLLLGVKNTVEIINGDNDDDE
jgi:hypothetical protein